MTYFRPGDVYHYYCEPCWTGETQRRQAPRWFNSDALSSGFARLGQAVVILGLVSLEVVVHLHGVSLVYDIASSCRCQVFLFVTMFQIERLEGKGPTIGKIP